MSSSKPATHGHRPSIVTGGSISSNILDDESLDQVNEDAFEWVPQKYNPVNISKIAPEKKHGLSALLEARMNRETFEAKFLPSKEEEAHASSSSSAASSTKQIGDSSDSLFNRSAKLNALLISRPSKGRLEAMGVLKAPSTVAPVTGSFAAMQHKLQSSQRRDKLSSFLSSRPDRGDLEKRNILKKDAHVGDEQERIQIAKCVLGDFIAARPNPEQLVQQKIITDIGDLPSGLEKKSENQTTPKFVHHLSHVQSVSLGFAHSLALDSHGKVHVWGTGVNGRLGLGNELIADVSTPTLLKNLPGAASSVDAGETHSAAIVNGQVYTWGVGSWGRLGTGSQEDEFVPRLVRLVNKSVHTNQQGEQEVKEEEYRAKQISCGAYHTLVLTECGRVFAFGWNKNGRCGVGKKHPSLTLLSPVEISFFSASNVHVSFVEASAGFSVALSKDGDLYSWGVGSFGALGHGDEQDVWEPKKIEVATKFSKVAVGANYTIALSSDAKLWAWGSNHNGQLAQGNSGAPINDEVKESSHGHFHVGKERQSLTPVQADLSSLNLSSPIASVAVGKSISSFVLASGAVYTFGQNARGVLGLGEIGDKDVGFPTRVEHGEDGWSHEHVKSVDMAWSHCAAVTNSGKLYTWGAKTNGRLGY